MSLQGRGLRNRRSEVRILSGALHETALASQMRCNPASRGRRRVGTGWNENAPRPASRGGSRRTRWRWLCGPRFSNLSLYHRAAAVGEAFTSSASPAARSDPPKSRSGANPSGHVRCASRGSARAGSPETTRPTEGGAPRSIDLMRAQRSLAWIRAVSASLPPCHECRSDAATDRALTDAWCWSIGGVLS